MDEPETATVVEGDASATVADAARKPKPRGAPKWETEARDRLKAAIRRFSKPLADLVARDANEGDTRLLVTDFLCDGLGFDKYADLTTEYQVKGEFADYGVRIDRELVAFIEVKRVATKLSTRHLRQVEMYAVNEGVEWIILTNGSVWQVYHITGGLPVAIDLALEVDLLGDEPPAHKVNQLFFLSRESLKKRQIDELWKAKRATSPASLAQVLVSDNVAEAIRKELWRQTGHRIDTAEIVRLISESVLRPGGLQGSVITSCARQPTMPRLNPAYRRRMSLSKVTRAIIVAGLLATGVVVSYSSQPPASAAPPCVVIYRIYYNSPGTDTGSNYSLNGEWIQLRNRCSTGRSLESWRIRDVAGHTYIFGDFRLGGGQYVKVRTGNGTATATNLYQGKSWYVWNNDKDTAYLRNAEGTLIDTCSYNNKSASSVYC